VPAHQCQVREADEDNRYGRAKKQKPARKKKMRKRNTIAHEATEKKKNLSEKGTEKSNLDMGGWRPGAGWQAREGGC